MAINNLHTFWHHPTTVDCLIAWKWSYKFFTENNDDLDKFSILVNAIFIISSKLKLLSSYAVKVKSCPMHDMSVLASSPSCARYLREALRSSRPREARHNSQGIVPGGGSRRCHLWDHLTHYFLGKIVGLLCFLMQKGISYQTSEWIPTAYL